MSYLLEKFKMKGKVMEVCDRYARNIIASLSTVAHTGNYNDLSNKPTIPSAQVNSDWNATSGVAEILNKPSLATVATSGSYNDLSNKPTIPEAQVNSDWNSTGGVSEILNKPSLATVATSGSYNDLSNKPTIPAEQVNSDWNATSGKAQILHKPSLATVATSGSYSDLSNKPTIPTVNNGTLTIQKNGTSVATFTANQSGNATANITCENKISWSSSGNWTYWKDSANVYHLHFRKSESINFNGTLGGLKYRTTTYDINLPVSLSAYRSINVTTECGSDLTGATVQSASGSAIKLYLWAAQSGTKTVYIDLEVASL